MLHQGISLTLKTQNTLAEYIFADLILQITTTKQQQQQQEIKQQKHQILIILLSTVYL